MARVGMFGGSYVGATQMLAAIAHPPHLAGICPFVTASNYHSNWTYQGGAFEQWFNESWTSGLAQDTFNRDVRQAHERDERHLATAAGLVSRCSTTSPTAAVPVSTATLAPYFLDWLAHPSEDALLEAVVDRGALLRHHRAAADDCRLVRHLPGRLAPELHRRQGPRRNRRGAATASTCS